MTSAPTPRRVTALAVIIVWNVVSTTVHYAHNFVMAQHYPPVYPFFPNELAYRIGIAVFWPVLTVIGIRAFLRYRAGKVRGVAIALAAYSLLGFTTIFHFAGGVPHIPPFFFATIFTDFLGGCALLVFAAYVARERARSRVAVVQ